MTKQEILDFFLEFQLHISDGVDSCSGEDYRAMEEAAEELVNRISIPKTLLAQQLIVTTEADVEAFHKDIVAMSAEQKQRLIAAMEIIGFTRLLATKEQL